MALSIFFLLQSVAGPPVPPSLRSRPSAPVASCPVVGASDEIVVCASRDEDQRLQPLIEPAGTSTQDPMAFRLPGAGTGSVRARQSTVGGFTGQGAVVTLKIPLGGRKKRPD